MLLLEKNESFEPNGRCIVIGIEIDNKNCFKTFKGNSFSFSEEKKLLSLVNVLGGNKYVCDKHSLIQQNGTYCFDQKSYFSVIAPTSTEREF